jgi:hypothetical protein
MEKKQVLAVPYHLVYSRDREKEASGGFAGRMPGRGAAGHAPAAFSGPRTGSGKSKHFVYRPAGTKIKRPAPGPEPEKTNGKGPVRQPVKVGETDYHHYEILRGLQEGDTVVSKPRSPEDDERREQRRGRR